MKAEIKILDQRLGKEFALPRYATTGSAGLDLLACLPKAQDIEPGKVMLVPSGIAIHLGDPNHMAMLAPRSGLGIKQRIILANSVGIIDSDYQNEIKVALWNVGDKSYTVEPGERICQLIVVRVDQPQLECVTEFSATTDRALGGLGHTGRF